MKALAVAFTIVALVAAVSFGSLMSERNPYCWSGEGPGNDPNAIAGIVCGLARSAVVRRDWEQTESALNAQAAARDRSAGR